MAISAQLPSHTAGTGRPIVIYQEHSELALPAGVRADEIEAVLVTGFGEECIADISRALAEEGVGKLALARFTLAGVKPQTGMIRALSNGGGEDAESIKDDLRHSIHRGTDEIKAILCNPRSRDEQRRQVSIIGISAGGRMALESALYEPDFYSDLYLVESLGLNNEHMTDFNDFNSRRRQEKRKLKEATPIKRYQHGDEHVLTVEERSIARSETVLGYILRETEGPAAARQLHQLGLLRKVIAGAHDVWFPPAEMQAELGPDIEVESIYNWDHLSLTKTRCVVQLAELLKQILPSVSDELVAA